MRLRTFIRWSVIVCGVLALALAVFVLSFDLNQYRHPLEAAASKALGRAVTLGGPLTLAASLSPTITAEQVRIANPGWASRPHLAEAARAEIQIDLLPLLRDRLVVRQIGLDGVDILLESTADGANNWTFGEKPGDLPNMLQLPYPLTVTARRSTLAYRSPTSNVGFALTTIQAVVAEDRPLHLSGEGIFRGVPLTLNFEAGTPENLRTPAARWPVTLSLQALDASLTAQGTAALQAGAHDIDLQVALRGERLNALDPLLDWEMPALGPYELVGRVSTQTDGIALNDLRAKLSDSNVAGDVTLALTGPRKRLAGKLTSQTVRLDQLLKAINRPIESTPPPDLSSLVATLRGFDAAVEWQAERLFLGSTVLDKISLTARLKDGRLEVKPFAADHFGGHIVGALDIDTQGEEPTLAVEIAAHRLDVGRTLAQLTVTDRIEGIADLTLNFSSRGSTFGSLLAQGTLQAAVGPSTFLLHQESHDNPTSFRLITAEVSAAQSKPITLQLKSVLRDQPLTLTAIGGPLAHLVEAPQAWPIALSAQSPTFMANVKGTVAPPWNQPGLDLAVTLKGTQLHALSTMFPTSGPYELTGQVTGAHDTYRVSRLAARLAGSDVAGSVTLAMTAPRPRLTGTLTSKSVVLDQLIDTNPSTPVPGKPAPPLDFAIPIEELKRIDADLSWHVSSLILRAKPLGDFGLTVDLLDGRLHAAPVQALSSGGTIRANLDVDGSKVPPTASLTATGRKIDYGRLTQVLGITERLAGNADFDIALAGTGTSFQGWLRQGSLSFATGPTTITIHDQHQGPDLQFEIGKVTAASKEGGPVQTTAEGIFRAQPFTINASGGTVAGLIAHQGAWPLAVATQTAGASIDLKGELRLPLDGENFLFQAHLKGDRLKDLDPILNQQLPALGAYEFTGTLADTKAGYRLTNMDGRIDGSDIHGNLTLVVGGPRWRLNGDLRSETVTLPISDQPTASPPSDETRIIPNVAVPISGLREFEMDLGWQMNRFVAGAIDLGKITFKAHLENGRLQVTPFQANLLGGVMDGSLSVDASKQVPIVALKTTIRNLDLGRLLKGLKSAEGIEGAADITLDLEGRGTTLQELLRRANGQVEFIGGPGNIKSRYLNLWASELVLAMWSDTWKPQELTQVNCLIARFGLTEGLGRSDGILFDTTSMTVAGIGTVDLAGEYIDVVLTPRPKNLTLISLAHTARLKGPLSNPDVSTDPKDIAKSAAWVALGVTNPFGLAISVVALGVGVVAGVSNVGTGVANPCDVVRTDRDGKLSNSGQTSRSLLDRAQDRWSDFREWLHK
ncbi:MAG: AsmA family protein [Nitrospira sp.]